MKVRLSRNRIGGEALQRPNVPPQPCQEQEENLVMSKVKGPVLLDRMGGGALQRPNVPPRPCQEQEENLILT